MKKALLLFCVAGIALAGDYVITGNPFHGFKTTSYLQSLDWKTNAVPAVAWLELQTNKTPVKADPFCEHATQLVFVLNPSPCQCAQAQGRVFTRTTTVDLIRIVEVEGQRYPQRVKHISGRTEKFTVE